MHEVRQTIHQNVPGTIGFFFGRFPPLHRLYLCETPIVTQGFRPSYLDEPVKLAELRAKTDEQLQGIVNSKLELGLNFVVLGEVEESGGDRAKAERSLKQANQALSEVVRLLPALNEDQRRAFDPKLNELRAAVERLGGHRASGMTHTASAL